MWYRTMRKPLSPHRRSTSEQRGCRAAAFGPSTRQLSRTHPQTLAGLPGQVKPVYRCPSCGMQFTGSTAPVCPACLIRTVRIDDVSARTLATPLLSGEDARTDAMMRSNRGTVGRD